MQGARHDEYAASQFLLSGFWKSPPFAERHADFSVLHFARHSSPLLVIGLKDEVRLAPAQPIRTKGMARIRNMFFFMVIGIISSSLTSINGFCSIMAGLLYVMVLAPARKAKNLA